MKTSTPFATLATVVHETTVTRLNRIANRHHLPIEEILRSAIFAYLDKAENAARAGQSIADVLYANAIEGQPQ